MTSKKKGFARTYDFDGLVIGEISKTNVLSTKKSNNFRRPRKIINIEKVLAPKKGSVRMRKLKKIKLAY